MQKFLSDFGHSLSDFQLVSFVGLGKLVQAMASAEKCFMFFLMLLVSLGETHQYHLMGCPWFINVIPWDAHGSLMSSHGMPIGMSYLPMGYPISSHGISFMPMVHQYHPMGCPWFINVIPWDAHWDVISAHGSSH
jgi:hypothetical protein